MKTLSIAIMGMLIATMKHFTRPLAVALIVLGFAAQTFAAVDWSGEGWPAYVGWEMGFRGQIGIQILDCCL